ncbi:hypothetical protein EJ08DRAFT_480548 [Tothia fuscella]|uniref:Uncharacterized protein n=1 Tax=Tothia fuscella TaxID=1048955 RepID=A0A9P4NII4_9PEZI|nr:hypothetical protein EJ08DRAFT_480548 [Tothia fuscella]
MRRPHLMNTRYPDISSILKFLSQIRQYTPKHKVLLFCFIGQVHVECPDFLLQLSFSFTKLLQSFIWFRLLLCLLFQLLNLAFHFHDLFEEALLFIVPLFLKTRQLVVTFDRLNDVSCTCFGQQTIRKYVSLCLINGRR